MGLLISNFPWKDQNEGQHRPSEKLKVSEVGASAIAGVQEASCPSRSRFSPAQDVTPSSGIPCNTFTA